MNYEELYANGESKYVPEGERAAMPAADFAGPGRTFPINSQAHVHAAAALVGHAADPSDVKKKIIAIAKRKGFALPNAWQDSPESQSDHYGSSMMMNSKTWENELVVFGGEVKLLGSRKVGGYGVLFTTPKDPDLSEDFFHKTDTDFDIRDGDVRSLYYNHGFDATIGNHKIGSFTTRKDDVGMWIEGQLREADEYADAVLSMVEQGKLGYSSGAVSHLVRREPVGKSTNVHKITSWPIGEMSLTNKPAEPRAWAVPLKSLFNQETSVATQKAAVSISTLRELESYLHRDGGLSVQHAKVIASKFSLRDVESAPEATSDTFRADVLRELARTELQRSKSLGIQFA